MNFADTLKFLASGRKVKMRGWSNDKFIELNNNRILTQNKTDYIIDYRDYNSDWDIWEVPVDPVAIKLKELEIEVRKVREENDRKTREILGLRNELCAYQYPLMNPFNLRIGRVT